MSRHGKFSDKSVQVTFVADKATKAALQAMADAQKRTLSNLLKLEMERLVEERIAVGELDAILSAAKRSPRRR
jgi:hypothetical protein